MLHDIPPKLLHKDSADDVLLRRYRPALPLSLTDDDVARLGDLGAAAVARLYRPDADGRWRLDVAGAGDGARCPSTFEREVPVEPRWLQARAIPFQMLPGASDPAVAAALALLDTCPVGRGAAPSVKDVFRSSSYELLNQADHYFFYRKEHEHVPGVMLIEAQRQAVYAHLYSHTRHVRGDVTVSLNRLDSEFFGYVELMYPVELVVDDLGDPRQPLPRKIDYRVSFYQRGKLVAIIDTAASVIDMTRFGRLRGVFHASADDWFAPIDASRVACSLSTAQHAARELACVGVSRHGCITAPPGVPVGEAGRLTVRHAAGLEFTSEVVLEREANGKAVWRFVDASAERLAQMGEMIKRSFTLYQPQ